MSAERDTRKKWLAGSGNGHGAWMGRGYALGCPISFLPLPTAVLLQSCRCRRAGWRGVGQGGCCNTQWASAIFAGHCAHTKDKEQRQRPPTFGTNRWIDLFATATPSAARDCPPRGGGTVGQLLFVGSAASDKRFACGTRCKLSFCRKGSEKRRKTR